MNKSLHLVRTYMVIAFLLIYVPAFAQPVLNFQLVASGLTEPVDIVSAPGDARLFVAQQNGLVRAWNGTSFSDFISLAPVIVAGGEQGLLSIVFHPGYATNGYFFVWYTATDGAVTLARYRRNITNPSIGDPSTGQVLLRIPKPGNPYFTNHNGGKLNFGSDGMLYIGTGDGGDAGDPLNNAQDVNSLLGKMLRIDVNGFLTSSPFYTIPASNPFIAPGDGIKDEIYAIGLRNPWRWSFDRATGDMWIADVGQGAWEEVNWRPATTSAGVNYGWRCYEGAHIYAPGGCTPTDTVSPVFEYPHNMTTGGFSVTGGYVYRGPDAENVSLLGYYIMADYVSGNVWLVRQNGQGGFSAALQAGLPTNISSFGEANDGTLYALGRATGNIYKVMTTAVVPVRFTSFSGVARRSFNELEWVTNAEVNTRTFHVEHSSDGLHFLRVGQVTASGNTAGSRYSFQHFLPPSDEFFYRLAIEDADGSLKYSPIIRLSIASDVTRVYPTVLPGNSPITIVTPQDLRNVQLINSMGRIAWQRNMTGLTGTVNLVLPQVPKGVYILRINGQGLSHQEKIIIE